jgi:hypothetical protein
MKSTAWFEDNGQPCVVSIKAAMLREIANSGRCYDVADVSRKHFSCCLKSKIK